MAKFRNEGVSIIFGTIRQNCRSQTAEHPPSVIYDGSSHIYRYYLLDFIWISWLLGIILSDYINCHHRRTFSIYNAGCYYTLSPMYRRGTHKEPHIIRLNVRSKRSSIPPMAAYCRKVAP